MSDLRVEPVDPRDLHWEVWEPMYRVYFWRPFEGGGWASDEFEVSGGDVRSTLAWAAENAREGQTYQVFCIVPDVGRGIGLIRLTGEDPTRT